MIELLKLQKIQNSETRILTGAKRHSQISPVLKQLHWLPISSRIKYKISTLTYKCINNLAPICFSELVTLRTEMQWVRSADDDLTLATPRTKLVVRALRETIMHFGIPT